MRSAGRRAAWVAAIAGVAGAVAVSPALAQGGDNATSGIARAKAAGITIDPAAEEIMAAAPVGSCLNDPTQSTCDTPTRIVAMPDGGTTTEESAALFPFCWVYATSLVRSTGNARAYGKFSCTSIADVMELYVTLWIRWKDGSWHQVNVGKKGPSGPGPGSIYANTAGYCRDTAERYFGDVAEGYAEAEGTWYATVARLYDYLPCVV